MQLHDRHSRHSFFQLQLDTNLVADTCTQPQLAAMLREGDSLGQNLLWACDMAVGAFRPNTCMQQEDAPLRMIDSRPGATIMLMGSGPL